MQKFVSIYFFRLLFNITFARENFLDTHDKKKEENSKTWIEKDLSMYVHKISKTKPKTYAHPWERITYKAT